MVVIGGGEDYSGRVQFLSRVKVRGLRTQETETFTGLREGGSRVG